MKWVVSTTAHIFRDMIWYDMICLVCYNLVNILVDIHISCWFDLCTVACSFECFASLVMWSVDTSSGSTTTRLSLRELHDWWPFTWPCFSTNRRSASDCRLLDKRSILQRPRQFHWLLSAAAAALPLFSQSLKRRCEIEIGIHILYSRIRMFTIQKMINNSTYYIS